MIERLRAMLHRHRTDRRSEPRAMSSADEGAQLLQRLTAAQDEINRMEEARLLRLKIETEQQAIRRGYQPNQWEEMSG